MRIKKRIHRQFSHILDEKLVDKEQSYQWLTYGDIKGGNKSVQDQVLSSNYFKQRDSERRNLK